MTGTESGPVQKLIPQVDLYFTQLHPCRQRCLDGIIENNPETESLFFVRQQRQVETVSYTHLDVYKRQL